MMFFPGSSRTVWLLALVAMAASAVQAQVQSAYDFERMRKSGRGAVLGRAARQHTAEELVAELRTKLDERTRSRDAKGQLESTQELAVALLAPDPVPEA